MAEQKNTKHIRLYERLKKEIETGLLQPGERLPSKRHMAKQAQVSTVTVAHAYALLEAEGLVVAKERSGCYVSDRIGSREEKTMKRELLAFSSDYMKGAHPAVMKRLAETNLEKSGGYGTDPYCEAARKKIQKACGCKDAHVTFLTGGTQTNATVIDAFLRPWQGVIAAETGHISVHEAGAIEAGGHKVLTVPHKNGKLDAVTVRAYLKNHFNDETHEHMVAPGMLYLSHPTEYGTLYRKAELKALREVCDEYGLSLYLDGARLAYALACPENDVTLKDLAKLSDAFYIGGTKCGALFGEAVVIPDPSDFSGFFTMVKQHGALLAKGRLLGLQFDTLFTGDLYLRIGENAIRAADRIRKALRENGYRLCFDSPTNQVFCVMENRRLKEFGKFVNYGFWEIFDDTHTIIRLATDWGTTDEEVDELIDVLREL